jgi:hypothetical protein
MALKKKLHRSTQERIGACESHLFFLHEDLKLFPQQYDRYKQIAGKLRLLVCAGGRNKPLLLDLMDEVGFTYEVQPPGPLTIPIPPGGWRDGPDYQALTLEIQQAAGDRQKLAAIHERQAKLRKPMSLREYTDKALATFIKPYDYSFNELVRSIAQQCGSSHEDESIDEPIAQMRSLVLNGVESHVAVMVEYAGRVLDAGAKFILYSVEKGLYQARYFARKTV